MLLRFALWAILAIGLTLPISATSYGQNISAYMYTKSGSGGISSLANKKPGAINNVYLDAIDIDVNGKTYVKNSGGHFYPHFWTVQPPAQFTAMISVDPNLDWSAVDPTGGLLSGLQSNAWHSDYNAGIHIDAEFTADLQVMPQTWIDCLSALRKYTNQEGRNFSMYYNPKYLSSSRYSSAAANADAIAAILGGPSSQFSNEVFFPVYADSGMNADLETLNSAAKAVLSRQLNYQWIHDITESTTTFSDGLNMAHQINNQNNYLPQGVNVYSYLDDQPVTPDMKANLKALLGNPNSIPEPTSLAIWAMIGLGSAGLRRRRI